MLSPPRSASSSSANQPLYPSRGACLQLSSLPCVPGYRIRRYLGIVSLHFIKESWEMRNRSQEKLGAFFNVFLLEVNSMVRAHTAALGANALVCYTASPEGSQGGRNQVYHMMSVMGHAVVLEPIAEEQGDATDATDPTDPRLAAIRRTRASVMALTPPP